MSKPPIDLSPFIKAYDVRGLVGTQLTDEVVHALGAAFADEVGTVGGSVVVGHDMRDSSPGFAAQFAAGARDRGVSVVAIGLCSTDETYFASGNLDGRGMPTSLSCCTAIIGGSHTHRRADWVA